MTTIAASLDVLGLDNNPLTRQALPYFTQLLSLLVSHAAPGLHPQYHEIEDCLKAFTILGPFVIQELSNWQDPVYGHCLGCFIRLLYPAPQSPRTTPSLAPLTQQQLATPTQPYDNDIIQSQPPQHILTDLFIKYGCNVTHQQCETITVLHSFLSTISFSPRVSAALHPKIFQTISGKFINHFDSVDDYSPLMIAINNPYTLHPFDLLLDHPNIDVNSPSNNGKRILQYLIQKGSFSFPPPPLQSPQSPSRQTPAQSTTDLSSSTVAANTQDPMIHACQLVVNKGAKVHYPSDPLQMQPLSLAISLKQDAVGEFLVSQGYPVNSYYSTSQLVVQAAISQYMTKTAIALLKNGADASKKNHDGNTLLHLSVMYNNIDVAHELLLNHGMDVEARNLQGQSPLECLMQHSHAQAQMITLLLQRGADPNKMSAKQVPIICQALFRHNYDQVRALLTFTAKTIQFAQNDSNSNPPDPSNPSKLSPTPHQTVPNRSNSNKEEEKTQSPSEEPKKGWFRSIFSSKSPPPPPPSQRPKPLPLKPIHRRTLPNVNQPAPRQIYCGSVFLYACSIAPQDIVEIMIRHHNASLLQKNENNLTALHIAVQRSQEVLSFQKINAQRQQQWIDEKCGGPIAPIEYQMMLTQQRQSYHAAAEEGQLTLLRTSTQHSSSTTSFPHQASNSPVVNRKVVANSFHLSNPIYDPLEVLSGFELTSASLNAIPTYDPTDTTIQLHQPPILMPTASLGSRESSSQLHSPQRNSSFHSTSQSSLLSSSSSQNQVQTRKSYHTPHTPARSPSMMLNLGGIHQCSTPASPINAQASATAADGLSSISSTPSTTPSTTTRNLIIPSSVDQQQSAHVPITTPTNTTRDSHTSNKQVAFADQLSTISSIASPAASPYSPQPAQQDDEDEEVVFLGRLLKTIYEHFMQPHDDFEFV